MQAEQVILPRSVFEFAMAEMTEIHRQCDIAGAPRFTDDGAPMSAAQRVTHVVGTLMDLRAAPPVVIE